MYGNLFQKNYFVASIKLKHISRSIQIVEQIVGNAMLLVDGEGI